MEPGTEDTRTTGKIQNRARPQRRPVQRFHKQAGTVVQLTKTENTRQSGNIQMNRLAVNPGPGHPLPEREFWKRLDILSTPDLAMPGAIGLGSLRRHGLELFHGPGNAFFLLTYQHQSSAGCCQPACQGKTQVKLRPGLGKENHECVKGIGSQSRIVVAKTDLPAVSPAE